MKKGLKIILSLFMCLGLAACSSKSESTDTSEDALERIKSAGKLVVGMEGNWSPWNYHDEDDNLVGYDVEVAKYIADYLGVEIEYVEGDWDGLLAGVDSGRYDMIVNGVDYTEERAEKYNFSEPYCYMRTALIVRGDNTSITSFDDLKGKSTCNSVSSTYIEMAEEYGAETTAVDSLDQTFELVLAGRCDATLNAELSYADYMAQHPDANLKIVAKTEEANTVCIPMAKENTDALKKEVDAAIEAARADGTLSELSQKYFNCDISSDE